MSAGIEINTAEAVGEATGDVVEAVIEQAEARAEQAEAVAEAVTEAALENERVHIIDARIAEWQGQLLGLGDELRLRLGEVEAQLSSLRETQLSPETLALLLAMTQPATQAPSIPSPQPTPEPTAPVEEPAAAADAPADESREAAPRAKRHRFL